MYSWKATRLVCMILISLPIVHLVYLASRDMAEFVNPSPKAFQRDLDAYQRRDQQMRLPEKPILVVGGRRVKLWQGLDMTLAPNPVLMRGLGDAIVEDITANYQRLIGYYRPRAVVLLTGNSEFLLRAQKGAQELSATIRDLIELDASHGYSEQFYVISPLKTPLRPGDDVIIEEAMHSLASWAEANPHVTLLDANSLLRGAGGRPDPMYFRSDGLQLNEHGYLRLTVLLQSQLLPQTTRTAQAL